MKKLCGWLCLVLVLGLSLGWPLAALAAEHGGKSHAKEHGGKEHGGKETKEDAGKGVKEEERAIYTNAADALGAKNQALANQLRAWANGQEKGEKSVMLKDAMDSLKASNPDLADKLKALLKA